MNNSASDEIEAFHSAEDDDEREYWTRQIMKRKIRAHDERNQDLLRREYIRLASVIVLAAGAGGACLFAFVKLWA